MAPVFSLDNSGYILGLSLPSPHLQKRSNHIPDHVVKESVRFHMHEKEVTLPLDLKAFDHPDTGAPLFYGRYGSKGPKIMFAGERLGGLSHFRDV